MCLTMPEISGGKSDLRTREATECVIHICFIIIQYSKTTLKTTSKLKPPPVRQHIHMSIFKLYSIF